MPQPQTLLNCCSETTRETPVAIPPAHHHHDQRPVRPPIPHASEKLDLEVITHTVEARVLEIFSAQPDRILESRRMAKVVEQAVAEQLNSIKDGQRLLSEEVAALREQVRNSAERFLVADVAGASDPMSSAEDTSAAPLIAGQDAKEVLQMLEEWREACRDQEFADTKPIKANELPVDSDGNVQRKDFGLRWIGTFQNKCQRFPRLGRRRQAAATNALAKNTVLSVAPQDAGDSDGIECEASEEVKKLVEVYTWVESVWDLGMLIGAIGPSRWNAIFSGFLVAGNVVMQVLLCIIINDAFTTPAVSTDLLQDLSRWRASIAHDIQWVDGLTDQTLVSQICEGHSILPLSSSVADVFAMTTEYIGTGDLEVPPAIDPVLTQWWMFDPGNVGICLCILACTIWWMILSQDMMHVLDLLEAVRAMPSGTTQIRRYGQNRSLVCLSFERKVSIVLLLFLRAAVCCILFLTGTLFLAYTVTMSDILLNAAALSIVLELDNLIFVAFAPGSARALLKSMLPIPRHHDTKLFGVSVRYPAVVLFMVISAIVVTHGVLLPQATKIEQAQTEICGGNLDFVSALAANGALVAAHNHLKMSYEDAFSTYRFQAMQQLINDRSKLSSGMSTPTSNSQAGDLSGISVGVRGPSYSIKAISEMPVDEITGYWNTDCADAPGLQYCSGSPGQGCWQMFILHNVTRNRSIESCADVLPYCGSDSLAGVRTRQYCPHTCGCDDPHFASLFPSLPMGCPISCRHSTKEVTALSNSKCEDLSNTSAGFQSYLQAVDLALASYPPGQRSFATPVKIALASQGCQAVTQPIDTYGYKVDLCADFNFLNWKPLNLVCPISCRCKDKSFAASERCPNSCNKD